MRQEKSKALLDLLVQEFHLWQELARLTRAERHALVACEAPLLADLARQKGDLLSNLAAYQQSRREVITAFASPQPLLPGAPPGISIQTLLAGLADTDSGCLLHLAEGIQTLADQIGELAQGNYALADCAMKRAWALQNWVQQEGQKSLPSLPASVLAARDVLTDAISEATPAAPPAWSRPLDLLDQDLFAVMLAKRVYEPNNLG